MYFPQFVINDNTFYGTSATTTNNITLYPHYQSISSSPKHETNLEWLKRRVEEITNLVSY